MGGGIVPTATSKAAAASLRRMAIRRPHVDADGRSTPCAAQPSVQEVVSPAQGSAGLSPWQSIEGMVVDMAPARVISTDMELDAATELLTPTATSIPRSKNTSCRIIEGRMGRDTGDADCLNQGRFRFRDARPSRQKKRGCCSHEKVIRETQQCRSPTELPVRVEIPLGTA